MLLARTLTYCGPDLVVLKKERSLTRPSPFFFVVYVVEEKSLSAAAAAAAAAADAVVAAGGCIFKDLPIKHSVFCSKNRPGFPKFQFQLQVLIIIKKQQPP